MKKHLAVLTCACIAAGALSAQSVKEESWGKTKLGEPVKLYTLKNASGMTVKVTDYGAVITEIFAPDRDGNFADIVLGFDNIKDYEELSDYFGAVVGRYGNRIADGTFSIDGQEYNLPKNNGKNTLHGGTVGFDKKVWTGKTVANNDAAVLTLTLKSPDGDQGFPGNLEATVTYTLNNDNELVVNYKAATDKATVCNLTQHAYFNLKGAGNGDILDHEVMLNADSFTPVDATLIPTGKIKNVENTPFDFRTPHKVGARVNDDNEQLKIGDGYDHNWVLNQNAPKEMTLAAVIYEPESGRELTITTTEPGIQFYCGNFLNGMKGKEGKLYNKRNGMCFETQHFPDSPNHDNFPSTVLRPGEVYDTTTVFKFSARE